MVMTTETAHRLNQKFPKKHNHYALRDFFQFDGDYGTITDWNNTRNVLTSEDFIIGLLEGLQEEVGDASAAIMYTVGLEWGKHDSLIFEAWFEREFAMSPRRANLMFLLETWWWPFISQGWGRWEVDMSDRKQGFMFINVFDSAVARTLGDVGKPVCHLYAGLFAGFFTEMVRKQLSCIEIQCYSMGETYCKFLLGGRERIDAAAFWMNEGANARDIEKRLRAGEGGQ
ncbi:V4R domain-containing protein [Nodosilinea sp. E11]|nr:V4R domain-containing protein [Nodosilinea sp. E11]WOD40702.1 V4R domain-containing protein [Nodosilinea sp. E11]